MFSPLYDSAENDTNKIEGWNFFASSQSWKKFRKASIVVAAPLDRPKIHGWPTSRETSSTPFTPKIFLARMVETKNQTISFLPCFRIPYFLGTNVLPSKNKINRRDQCNRLVNLLTYAKMFKRLLISFWWMVIYCSEIWR